MKTILKNKALLLSVFTIVLTVVFQLFFIRFASYSISREDYGNFVLIQTLLSGLMLFFMQMPIQAFDRFYNETMNKYQIVNEFRTLVLFLSSISFIIIILYGMILDKFSIELLFVIYILFIMLATYTISQRILLLNMDRGKYLYVRVLEAVSRFIFPIILYWYYPSLISLFLGMLAGYSFSLLLVNTIIVKDKKRIIFIWGNVKKYFIYAYPIFFFSMFNWGITFSDRYFIEYFLKTSDVGIYGLLGMVAGVGQILGQIYYIYVEPKILKEHSIQRNKAHRSLNRYLLFLSGVFTFLFIIAILLPKKVYTLVLDPSLINNDYYFNTMLILLTTIFIGIIHTAHHMHFKLFKKLNILAIIYMLALIVNIVGNLFIENYGIMAAAISTFISYLVILCLQIVYVSYMEQKGIIYE